MACNITFNNAQYTLTELAEHLNTSITKLHHLLKKHSPDQIPDILNKDKIIYKGKPYTIAQFAKKHQTNAYIVKRAIESNTLATRFDLDPYELHLPKPSTKGTAELHPNLSQFCKDNNVPYHLIYSRVCLGYTPEEAVQKPIMHMNKRTIIVNNKPYTLRELEAKTDIPYNTLYVTLIKRETPPEIAFERWQIDITKL